MRVLHLLMGILLTRLHASHQLYYQTCQDYTIDKCTYDQNGLIETLKDIDESSCQFFCDVVYKGLCNFFIYDHQQVMCELLQEPFGNYVDFDRAFASTSSQFRPMSIGSTSTPAPALSRSLMLH